MMHMKFAGPSGKRCCVHSPEEAEVCSFLFLLKMGIFFQPAMLLYQFSKWWYEFRDRLDVFFNRLDLYPYLILLIDEILHQLADSFSHFLPGFGHTRWCRISSIKSKIRSHRIHVWYIYLHLP